MRLTLRELELLPKELREQVESSLRSDRQVAAGMMDGDGRDGRDGRDGEEWTGSEKELQAAVEKVLRCNGWEYFHMPGAAAVGNPRGWPDLLCFGPGGRVALVELKRGGGRVSDAQAERFERLRALGHEVHVCRSVSDVQMIIDNHNNENC